MSTDLTGSVFEQRIADKKTELIKAAHVIAAELKGCSNEELSKSGKAFENLVAQCKDSIKFRLIVHLDLDCFFAQCEIDKNLKLMTAPMAVGSNYMLSTANYEARKYGVRSGMPGFQAKQRCPGLSIITPDFCCYEEASDRFFTVLDMFDPEYLLYVTIYDGPCKCKKLRMDDLLVECRIISKAEPIICDICNLERIQCNGELFYDVTVEGLVAYICDNILIRSNLLVTAGVAHSRLLAKVCSDINKPHGIFILEHDPKVLEEFIFKTPLKKFPGIGPKMTETLKEFGIVTGGDLWANRNKLRAVTGGETFASWYSFACIVAGVDGSALSNNSVDGFSNPSRAHVVSSEGQLTTGHEESFKKCSGEELLERGYYVIERGIRRAARGSTYNVGALHFKIKLANFEVKTFSFDLKESFALDDPFIVYSKNKFDGILKELGNVEVRLIGIRFGDLNSSKTPYVQGSMKKYIPEDDDEEYDDIEIVHEDLKNVDEPVLKKAKIESRLS
uniref:UmuC domain-containing protein n=1 Tax=Panagrolaimus sp. ES5 TaxID=591445 RepID=A0AC34FBC2_9BILA